jgi:hypothetical protein
VLSKLVTPGVLQVAAAFGLGMGWVFTVRTHGGPGGKRLGKYLIIIN